MQQHAVPQNISSFEFKLIGEMTIKQFFTLGIGLLLAWLFYSLGFLPVYIKWPLVLTFATAGAAFAFIPINDRPLAQWFINFFKAVFAPTQRIWIKSATLPIYLAPIAASVMPAPTHFRPSRVQLEAYLSSLPTGPKSQLDIAEEKFLTQLEFNTPGLQVEVVIPVPEPIIKPFVSQITKTTVTQVIKPIQPIKKAFEEVARLPGLEERARRVFGEIRPKPKAGSLASEINFTTQPVISFQTPDLKVKYIPEIGQIKVRKLHSFGLTGEFVLPIRGEKRIELENQVKEKFTSPAGGPALKFDAFEQFLQQPVIKPIISAPVIKTPPPKKVIQAVNISVPIKPVTLKPFSHPQIRPQIHFIQPQSVPKVAPPLVKPQQTPTSGSVQPQFSTTNQRNLPNIISGAVTDNQGNILSETSVTIRNTDGFPVRALQTNRLGQFSISTPLPNGKYTLEL